jgi:hypothetical protein
MRMATPSQIARQSNFMITINSNQRATSKTPELRRELYKRFINLHKQIQTGFITGKFTMAKGPVVGFKPPPLMEYKNSIEIGTKHALIHTHTIVRFRGTCHINVAQLRAFIQQSKYGLKSPHITVSYFKDTAAIFEAYADKQQGTQKHMDHIASQFPELKVSE